MLISKKDLLAITGISYGQLYRWKRERLIPEEWFIKQSSYTGQETFFPREQILSRIQSIQELKDKYSLEELAKILSPEVSPKNFTMEELAESEKMNKTLIPCFINTFQKEEFTYIEMLIMVIISEFFEENLIPFEQVKELILGLQLNVNKIKTTGMIISLLKYKEEHFTVIYQDQSQVLYDERFTLLKEIRMDEVSSHIKLSHRESEK